MKVPVITIIIDALGTVHKSLIRCLEELEIGGRADYSIIEIDQNTDKSPGDLKKLAVTQTPIKDHQLTLVWKIRNIDYPER